MKNSEKFYILKLSLDIDGADEKDKDSKRIKRAQDYVRFCVKLINEFSTKKFREWTKEELDNPDMLSARERGMKDLKLIKGIKYNAKDINKYIAIPKSDKKFVKFAKTHKPTWAEEKQKN